MQRFLGTIQQFFSAILVLSLVFLLTLPGLFIFGTPSALAVSQNPLTTPPSGDKTELGMSQKEKQLAYEEATQALQEDPIRGVEKLYEEEYAEYKESQPDQGLIESAKELVQDITGKS
ncbi:MAG TPA: hypothetical protein DD379_21195 [Cyanobacteria bacterium UBA11162]|nr:hypothetical protein [Cyanobacteria bacterium UBA11162]